MWQRWRLLTPRTPFESEHHHQFMKSKTIDEVCGSPPGTFKKFIAKQEEELREVERERKARIAKRRK